MNFDKNIPDECKAGTYRRSEHSECQACDGNTFSSAGATSCTDCAEGTVANEDKTKCGKSEMWKQTMISTFDQNSNHS